MVENGIIKISICDTKNNNQEGKCMVSTTVTIKNEQGLHMRPAGIFAKEMAAFNSDINIVFNGKKLNAKSVMNIIAGCIKCGSEITLECEGDDEQAALDKALELIESGFGE